MYTFYSSPSNLTRNHYAWPVTGPICGTYLGRAGRLDGTVRNHLGTRRLQPADYEMTVINFITTMNLWVFVFGARECARAKAKKGGSYCCSSGIKHSPRKMRLFLAKCFWWALILLPPRVRFRHLSTLHCKSFRLPEGSINISNWTMFEVRISQEIIRKSSSVPKPQG